MIFPIVAMFLLPPASIGPGGTFHWSRRLAPGQVIEIKGIAGDIRAERTAGKNVEVTAERTATSGDHASVHIEIVASKAGSTVCAIYPSRGAAQHCRSGPTGRLGALESDAKIHFTVRVPDGVRFVGRTENGSVNAIGLGADVEAHTVNGQIVLRTTRGATAETVNGSIKAATGSWEGAKRFSTVNGNIEIEVPKTLSADVSASTVYGKIVSDLPLAATNHLPHPAVRRGARRELQINTVNGSIFLKKTNVPAV